MARMHPFDEAIDLRASELQVTPHEFTGSTHPGYANMIGPFGGTTSAQLLQSAMLHPDRLGDPVALTVNFAAPVADGAIRFVARPVRTNRSTPKASWPLPQPCLPCAAKPGQTSKR